MNHVPGQNTHNHIDSYYILKHVAADKHYFERIFLIQERIGDPMMDVQYYYVFCCTQCCHLEREIILYITRPLVVSGNLVTSIL